MKSLAYFLRTNFKTVSFGWVLTFLSSFGQTFLISLYVPELIKTFAISEGTFGSIYALGTVIASVVLITVGHTIDHKPVKKVVFLNFIGLILSCLLLSFSAYNIALLIIAMIGLRLTGQGMLSHISQTVMSRFYGANRGKALSIAALGFPMGEAIFPICITTLIVTFGFEVAAQASAAFLILYLFLLSFRDLSYFDTEQSIAQKPSLKILAKDFGGIIKDRRFAIMMPSTFMLSFTSTAVFLYQYTFVEEKGWSVSLYAAFFTGYAITRFVMSIVGGLWVDKFTAKKLYRFFLIPQALGLLPFAFMDSIIGALLFLIATGITTGVAGTVKSAVLAEVYGTQKLGAVNSLFSMSMILSTAAAPLLIGFLIDQGVAFPYLMLTLFGLLVLAILNSQRLGSVPPASL
ncbi:MAG TPA: MFS transporter [Leeuwenhoekiella sp.]|nr:MFS transporter [Leeuwenhoekiella sp.]HBO30324.1 MFS transporter [Leeuwenhoekiella sp.]HCQ76191.1 MFS transporter [Leeuwenhoekiella sp.]